MAGCALRTSGQSESREERTMEAGPMGGAGERVNSSERAFPQHFITASAQDAGSCRNMQEGSKEEEEAMC